MRPRFPALLLLAACAEPTVPPPAGYTLVDVHAVSRFADCRSEANGINASGLVVGTLSCGAGTGGVGFLFQDGLIGLVDGGGYQTLALDVNDASQILIQGDTARPPVASPLPATWLTTLADPDARAYRAIHGIAMNGAGDLVGNFRGPYDSAGVLIGGVAMALGTTGGRVSGALGLSDVGTAVGWSENADFTVTPVRWTGGVAAALDRPAGVNGIATAINNAGVAVGWVTPDRSLPGGGEDRPARWDGTAFTELPTLGGARGWAYDINDDGDIVGASLTADGYLHATLWRGGEVIDLGTLEGQTESVAVRIASDGSVAGRSGGRAVMWRRN